MINKIISFKILELVSILLDSQEKSTELTNYSIITLRSLKESLYFEHTSNKEQDDST